MVYRLIKILGLAFIQNVSFSIISRSRNRDSKSYHIIASLFSNSIWFLTFRELILGDMNYILFVPYVIGAVIGSVFGVQLSMKVEEMIGASSDRHLKINKKKVLIKERDLARGELREYCYLIENPCDGCESEQDSAIINNINNRIRFLNKEINTL